MHGDTIICMLSNDGIIPFSGKTGYHGLSPLKNQIYFTKSEITTPVALSGMDISRKEAMDGAISVGDTR